MPFSDKDIESEMQIVHSLISAVKFILTLTNTSFTDGQEMSGFSSDYVPKSEPDFCSSPCSHSVESLADLHRYLSQMFLPPLWSVIDSFSTDSKIRFIHFESSGRLEHLVHFADSLQPQIVIRNNLLHGSSFQALVDSAKCKHGFEKLLRNIDEAVLCAGADKDQSQLNCANVACLSGRNSLKKMKCQLVLPTKNSRSKRCANCEKFDAVRKQKKSVLSINKIAREFSF